MVAGDFIGRRSEFLIAGDSEKRQLFHVVTGGKERKRRGDRKKKKRRKGGKEERKGGKERRKGGKGKGKKEGEKKDLGSKSINRDDESSVGGGVGRFFFQSPGGLPKTRSGTRYKRNPERQTRGTAFFRLWWS